MVSDEILDMDDRIAKQLEFFREGFPYLKVVSAATIERGIIRIDDHNAKCYKRLFDNFSGSVRKFVPASGAATRMFKDLYDRREPESTSFIEHIEQFAFYDDLMLVEGFDKSDKESVINSVILPSGLNYGLLPKGLIKFHKYQNINRTAFEEQLVEAAYYALSGGNRAKITVTVSPNHLDLFYKLMEKRQSEYEARYGCKYEVEFTIQKPSTDTIAVTLDNKPFLNSDGSYLFRPAGHGALIENLNEIWEELIFIKNIDNIVREENISESIHWKKILGGVLISVRDKIFKYIELLQSDKSDSVLAEAIRFMSEELCITLPSVPQELLRDFVIAKLNRPIRVCGMVKNEGEPGGGPYLVYDADGSISPQILEQAQLNSSDPNTKAIIAKSTHFNPVDIVCSTLDYKGDKFNLDKFIDKETGFISQKSVAGLPIKALELPGLWNGAMSAWNTVFVEVPLSTFNPVKSVLDLIRPAHRAF